MSNQRYSFTVEKSREGIKTGKLIGITKSKINKKFDTACLLLDNGVSYIGLLSQLIKHEPI